MISANGSRRNGTVQDEPAILRQRIAELEASNATLQHQVSQISHQLEQECAGRQQAEESLRCTRELLQTIVDTLPQTIFWKDRNSIYQGSNELFARSAGLASPADITGRSDYDLPWKHEAASLREVEMRILDNDAPELNVIELRMQANGREAWFRTSKVPLHDEAGNVIGILGTADDITEQKRLQEEYEQFFTISSDMLCTAGFDGYFKQLNPAWQRTLGFTPDELRAAPFLDLVHPDDQEATLVAAQHLTVGQNVVNFVNRYRCKDGSYRWIEWVSTSLPEQSLIYAIARDITGRKQAEEELNQQVQLLHSLINTIPIPIFYKDVDGVYLGCNRAFAFQVVGKPRNQVIGKTVYDVFPPDLASAYDQADQELFQKARSRRYEMEIPFADDSLHTVIFHKTVFPGPDGTPRGIVGAMLDVTERKQAEAEHAALQQQIIEAQQAALLELSTPLMPLTDDVVAMPLIGAIDTTRAQQIMETLLEGIAAHRAAVAILDITGVQVVDTQVANALVRAARAARLLGAQVVLTGIQPRIAQTIVELGADLSGIITRSTLQSGIAYALGRRKE